MRAMGCPAWYFANHNVVVWLTRLLYHKSPKMYTFIFTRVKIVPGRIPGIGNAGEKTTIVEYHASNIDKVRVFCVCHMTRHVLFPRPSLVRHMRI